MHSTITSLRSPLVLTPRPRRIAPHTFAVASVLLKDLSERDTAIEDLEERVSGVRLSPSVSRTAVVEEVAPKIRLSISYEIRSN